MINAIVQNKQGETAVIALPSDRFSIYDELRSIDLRISPDRLKLTDEDDDPVSLKLYSDSDIGNQLILLFNERHTLTDVNNLDTAVTNAREEIKEELEQNSEYLTFYNLLFVKVGSDPNNEADYVPYCYPGTSTPVSVETGKQISVLAQSDAVAYEDGRYKFNYLPAGIFAVKFQDGTRTISNYIASPANRGSDVTKDSNGIATYSDDRSQLLKTVITGIEMPKAEEMPVVCLESKYHDSGFYERGYELPKSGGAGAEIYTLGGFLMFTSAAFVLLNKYSRHRKKVL